MIMQRFRTLSFLAGVTLASTFATTVYAENFSQDEVILPGIVQMNAESETLNDGAETIELALAADGDILRTAPEAASAAPSPADAEPESAEFAVAAVETGLLDETRGTEGVKAETLASITSSSINNDFNVIMNGVSNETVGSFNNFNGVANNIQVTGPGSQVQTNTTINIYMVGN